uniref:Peptidase S1 domain-containing protein n=1 Tax=Timema douglasi TaxID=61478 RepID=A0A7R8VMM7_TIMDO|nr:unnamed protein product [Timema douglasi]
MHYKHTNIRIRAGSIEKQKNGTLHGVEEIMVHPNYQMFDYDGGDLDEDIAIIKLKDSLSTNPYVKYVELPFQGEPVVIGSISEVVGWGLTKTMFEGEATFLQKAKAEIVNVEDCEENPMLTGRFVVSDNMICAMGEQQTGYKGDSGGPLFTKEEYLNKHLRRGRVENHLEKTTHSLLQQDSNLYFPVLASLAQHETSALANYSTEADDYERDLQPKLLNFLKTNKLKSSAVSSLKLSLGPPCLVSKNVIQGENTTREARHENILKKQIWAFILGIRQGFLKDVMRVLKITGENKETHEKVAVIPQYDEMKINKDTSTIQGLGENRRDRQPEWWKKSRYYLVVVVTLRDKGESCSPRCRGVVKDKGDPGGKERGVGLTYLKRMGSDTIGMLQINYDEYGGGISIATLTRPHYITQ